MDHSATPGSRRPSIAGTGSSHLLMLVALCSAVLGTYYCFDTPAAINTPLREWLNVPYTEWQYELSLLYAVYSFPNIILPFLGGLVVDAFGASRTVLVFGSMVLIGQVTFASGVAARAFGWMVMGRALFGMGSETLDITTVTIATEWFQNHPTLGLSLVLAINLSSVRSATALNDMFSPWIANRFGVPWAPFVGALVCVGSFCAVLAVVILNGPRERSKRKEKETAKNPRPTGNGHAGTTPNGKEESTPPLFHPKPTLASSTATLNGTSPNYGSASSGEASTADLERSETPLSAVTSIEEMIGGYEAEMQTTSVWSRLGSLSLKFWVLLLLVISSYSVSNPFYNISTDFFQEKWFKGDPEKAGLALAVPPTLTALVAPFLGALADAYPSNRVLFLTASQALMLTAHIIFGWTDWSPFIGMTVLGLGIAILSTVLWPMVPEAAVEGYVASAYGLTVAVLNTTLTLVPLLVGHIRASDPTTWINVEAFFAFAATVGIMLCGLLEWVERRERRMKKEVEEVEEADGERRPLLEGGR